LERLEQLTTSCPLIRIRGLAPGMRGLDLSSPDISSVVDISKIVECTALERLSIAYAYVLPTDDDADAAGLTQDRIAGFCAGLRSFSSFMCSVVTGLPALTGLVEINLRNCFNFTRTQDLSACVLLERVILHGTRAQDMSFVLSGCCTRLKHLDICNTDVFDASPISACTSLISLDLSNTRVTDIDFISKLHRLEILNMSFLGGVSDISVVASSSCPYLRELSMANMPLLRDIRHLQHLKRLEYLNLDNNVQTISMFDVVCPKELYISRKE
jgi:Leucine-rich repeat (LRR) protein